MATLVAMATLCRRRARPQESVRAFALDRDALNQSMLRSVVDDHKVHGGPVVPESEVACVPVVANEEPLVHHVLIEELQQPVTLAARESFDVGRELRVHEQTSLAGLGVGPDQWVLDRMELSESFAIPLAVAVGADLLTERLFSVVNGHEPVEESAEGSGEPLVSRLRIRKHGVAATFGHGHRVEDRTHRWSLHECHIGMPTTKPRLPGRILPPGIVLADFGVIDLVEAPAAMVGGRRRVTLGDLSELCSKCEVLVGREVLFGEENDLVVKEGLADLPQGGGR